MTTDANLYGFDPAAVRGWIDTLGLGLQGELSFARVGGGRSNLTIEVRDATDRRWILRRPPLGTVLASAHDVVREAGILSALGPTFVPVPPVIGLCQDDRVADAPLLLMEHVDGVVLDSVAAAAAVDPATRHSVSIGMAEALAHVHAVDLEATGLTSLASHAPYAERQLRRWYRQWEASQTRELPALERITDLLRAQVPEQRETVLVHGDFHLANIICNPGSGAVRSVLDWELATLGDPLADLGTFLAYWVSVGDPLAEVFPALTQPGFATQDELVDAYLARTGRDKSAVRFWHALGLWKVAIISEGVLRRHRDGGGPDGRNEPPVTGLVERLVDQSLAVLSD